MDLRILEQLPDSLKTAPVEKLKTILGGPTLIHLGKGERPPVFVSCLLHGNEHTGWLAVKNLFNQMSQHEYLRSLIVLIGNVEAAQKNVRHLEHQPDFNRIWHLESQISWVAKAVYFAKLKEPFVAIDIHNNVGNNPIYGVVARTDSAHQQLASQFSRTAVFVPKLQGTLIDRFSSFCPSIVLECGKSSDPSGVEAATRFVESCLRMDHIPDRPASKGDFNLYHSKFRIKIPRDAHFDFDQNPQTTHDFSFLTELDRLNFSLLQPGTLLGYLNPKTEKRPYLESIEIEESYTRWLEFTDNEIHIASPCVPAMLCTSPEIARQDCLGYLMLAPQQD